MTDLSVSPKNASWHPDRREASVMLFLSGARGDAGALIGARDPTGSTPVAQRCSRGHRGRVLASSAGIA